MSPGASKVNASPRTDSFVRGRQSWNYASFPLKAFERIVSRQNVFVLNIFLLGFSRLPQSGEAILLHSSALTGSHSGGALRF
jgi:hypothetical protein